MEIRALGPGDAAQARAAHQELLADGFELLPLVDPGEAWDTYLARIARLHRGEGLVPGLVPWTDRFGFLDGVLVGRVSVRHELTDDLRRYGGHIGYGVRPALRRRGHATELLRAGLRIAAELGIDRALLTCADTNVASIRVIERCGGTLEDLVEVPGRPRSRRYWVPTGGDRAATR